MTRPFGPICLKAIGFEPFLFAWMIRSWLSIPKLISCTIVGRPAGTLSRESVNRELLLHHLDVGGSAGVGTRAGAGRQQGCGGRHRGE